MLYEHLSIIMEHKKSRCKKISIINMSVNGTASRPALLQYQAMGSTINNRLLNSLHIISKCIGFRCRSNVPNFDININVFEDYIPYSDIFVPKIPFPNSGREQGTCNRFDCRVLY